MGLDVGLHNDLRVVGGGHIVGVAHSGILLGTGGEGQNHCQNQKHGNQLFHVSKLLFHISYHGVQPHYTTGFSEINLFYGVYSAFH